jgi:hypothetical protein
MEFGSRMRDAMSMAAMTSAADALQRWYARRARHVRSARLLKAAGWLGAGAALGGALAALLTPYDGKQVRRRLRDDAKKVQEYSRAQMRTEDRE